MIYLTMPLRINKAKQGDEFDGVFSNKQAK